jgi:hypothetical protein
VLKTLRDPVHDPVTRTAGALVRFIIGKRESVRWWAPCFSMSLRRFAALSRFLTSFDAPKTLVALEECNQGRCSVASNLIPRGSAVLENVVSFSVIVGASIAFGCTVSGSESVKSSCESPTAEVQQWHMLDLDQRRRAFFKYEKRIREMSPQEKQFEYFASEGDTSTGFVMSPADVMRSVVAVYPPTGSCIIRAGSLPGEPMPHVPQHPSKFFEAFDLDKSGGLSFDEWLLVVSLLSIPVDDVEVAFALMDDNEDGIVDYQEFSKLLNAIKKRASRPTASMRKSPTLSVNDSGHGLVSTFFGQEKGQKLTLPKLKEFIANLRDEMSKLEFAWYDFEGKGRITGKDFAYSVVGSARIKHVDGYLRLIDNMPAELANAEITLDDFTSFRHLWRHLRRITLALECFEQVSGRNPTDADFTRIARKVLRVDLNEDMVRILHYLFPGAEGGINVGYMQGVMTRHYETGGSLATERNDGRASEVGGATNFWECLSNCISRMR